MNDLVLYAYALSAMIEMVVLEYVIRQVDFDSLNRKDPEWVRWSRRGTFLAGQVYLVITVVCGWFTVWSPSWFDVGLIWAGIFILSVNIVSLYLRQPPFSGSGYREFEVRYMPTPLRRLISILRRHP
jgi:hypothetical protein